MGDYPALIKLACALLWCRRRVRFTIFGIGGRFVPPFRGAGRSAACPFPARGKGEAKPLRARHGVGPNDTYGGETWMTASRQAAASVLQSELTSPTLFLSSEGVGWDDLVVRAYHEPREIEGWVDPVVPDTSLVLLTRGAMLMEQRHVNGSWKSLSVRQGNIFLKPGGSVTNELRWRSLSAEPMQTLHVSLNNQLLSRTAEELAGHGPARLTLAGRSGFQDPLLAQIGLALQRELEQPTAAGKLYAQTAAQMLAVHLLRYYTSPAPQVKEPARGLTQRQIAHVTGFILAHLNQDLSLSLLAQQAGFSPYHFARLFRRATGESPHQFVLRQRIERAKHLLREADLPLAQIAHESGFANQSHLTQAFKRHLGLTPAAFRKEGEIPARFY